MKVRHSVPISIIVSSFLCSTSFAGPVRDFEKAMRAAYGDYRAALFFTNTDQQENADRKLQSFGQKWSALAKTATAPPPQYADDTGFAITLSTVQAIAEASLQSVKQGKLADAHEKLEAIRDEIGKLHARNGIVGFSDHMNPYHAQMEVVLTSDYAGFSLEGVAKLQEDTAVLGYLADQVAAQEPAEASDPDFQPLLAAFRASVAAMIEAARSGDPSAIKSAKAKIKPAYAKFFLKFG